MEIKMHNHNFRRMFFDILRDTNTAKYSMTKFAALVGLLLLTATIFMALIIMWQSQEIDHVLIVEVLGFVLTLLGFKNNFGYKSAKDSITITPQVDDNQNSETDPDAGKMLAKIGKPDDIDDSLKG